ncbi:nucleotidyltransferase domain-containing protein [Parvicella tangerina]|uniref:Nucleotidyltransferase n=1 Tax=Parvicella tangerina TaxID=2829795 RepID=A0A916NFF2_9FLAO|nr:nucleotidyltransferase [Parvicella tangerina]CAG5077575.1 hypothetical protein CRYO30217_00430 [Parvicella tangerina]
MITEAAKNQYNDILGHLVETLDLTESQYTEAENRYKAVGNWLQKEGSPLAPYTPEVLPQGSFRLGTMIRPLDDTDTYDIDLVCKLNEAPTHYTQRNIKHSVGNRLKNNADYKRMLQPESQFCWTLKYADGTRFLMDIIPAVPDSMRRKLFSEHMAENLWQSALRTTDNESEYYDSNDHENWPKANPVGYAEWFKLQIQTFENKRKMFAESVKMKIEEVPDWRVKTPLQRAIQILKRHRDIMFMNDDNKPVSIIITTLAAKAYSQEDNIYDALLQVLDNMKSHISEKYSEKHNRLIRCVENPVNPEENFADMWAEYPKREEIFYEWLEKAKVDITNAISKSGLHNIQESLEKSFGNKDVIKAFSNYGDSLLEQRESGNLKMAAGTGLLGSTGRTSVKQHQNFGKKNG